MREREIFDAALAISDPAERSAYLAEASAGKPELRQHLAGLVEMHGQLGNFLEAPAAPLAAIVDRPPIYGPGTVIGPYKLLEQIGEGGMGLVFVAEQQQPVRRKVALKVIKPGMDSRQVVARFEAERQALALMDHPHIAKVFDGGATATGQPYFVMELVRGVPITEFCDQRRLTTRQRLELFVTVCQAVQHAHQKGIIHRNLKPSNVLVTLHDTVAVPKVIDFGIAKATTQPLTERTLHTNFAQMLGTPLYMSPEQAEMNGLDVDTRSDVYALGVMLYELLTGTTPFEGDTLKKVGLDEMRRLIREEEPPRPSQRVCTLGVEASTSVSERRAVDGRRLNQVLKGELDWIVMRALEKDRNRRYESASAFATDVQRYLSDEAVAACPPSAGYRLRKFARRNRRSLVTAGVITVVLVAATVVSALQAVVARDAQHQAEADRRQAETDRKQAEADRDRAKSAERQAKTEQDRAKTAERRAATDAAIARAVNEFLQQDLLGQAASAPPPDRELGGDPYLTVQEALDRASARIGQRFQDQPLVEAAIRTAIGAAYDGLFARELALPHLERAFELRKAHLDPDHPDTLSCMHVLAGVYKWVGRHPDSIALRQQLLKNRKALLGPDHPETLECLGSLAEAYQWDGQLETSARLLEELMKKQRAICGPTHPDTLGTMHELARTYGFMDQFTESMALYEKLLALRKSAFDPVNGSNNCVRGFAQVCQWAGKLDKADRLLRAVLEQERKRKDSVSQRNATANTLGYLAVNLLLQERCDEAEPLIREAVKLSHIGDSKHFYWVGVLGAVRGRQKKYDDAEPFLLQGYDGMKPYEKLHPAVRRWRAEAGGWIVRFYEESNQPDKVRAWREKIKPKLKDATPANVK